MADRPKDQSEYATWTVGLPDNPIAAYNQAKPESAHTPAERAGLAVDAYKKLHPEATFTSADIKEMANGITKYETANPGKTVSQENLVKNGIPAYLENRKTTHSITAAIGPMLMAIDNGVTTATMMNATRAGLAATSRWAGPVVGGVITTGMAVKEAMDGHVKEAAIDGASGLVSIGASAAAGAAIGTFIPVPVVGTALGFVAGAAVGTAAFYATKWGLTKMFNSEAEGSKEPVAVQKVTPFIPEQKTAVAQVTPQNKPAPYWNVGLT